MIGRHRIGALGMMALSLGLIPAAPSAEDRAAEKTINDLLAASLVITHSRLVLDMQLVMRAMGREMTTGALLDEVERFIRGESEIVQLGKAYPAAPAHTPGVIDLRPMYDLGARQVTIGDERGVPLAHVTLREDRSVHPRDIVSTRPVLGNRIPGPRMDVAATIASEAMKTLARTPKPTSEPSAEEKRRAARREERRSKRAALQASLGSQALRGVEVDYRTPKQERRAAKSRKRARKGWA